MDFTQCEAYKYVSRTHNIIYCSKLNYLCSVAKSVFCLLTEGYFVIYKNETKLLSMKWLPIEINTHIELTKDNQKLIFRIEKLKYTFEGGAELLMEWYEKINEILNLKLLKNFKNCFISHTKIQLINDDRFYQLLFARDCILLFEDDSKELKIFENSEEHRLNIISYLVNLDVYELVRVKDNDKNKMLSLTSDKSRKVNIYFDNPTKCKDLTAMITAEINSNALEKSLKARNNQLCGDCYKQPSDWFDFHHSMTLCSKCTLAHIQLDNENSSISVHNRYYSLSGMSQFDRMDISLSNSDTVDHKANLSWFFVYFLELLGCHKYNYKCASEVFMNWTNFVNNYSNNFQFNGYWLNRCINPFNPMQLDLGKFIQSKYITREFIDDKFKLLATQPSEIWMAQWFISFCGEGAVLEDDLLQIYCLWHCRDSKEIRSILPSTNDLVSTDGINPYKSLWYHTQDSLYCANADSLKTSFVMKIETNVHTNINNHRDPIKSRNESSKSCEDQHHIFSFNRAYNVHADTCCKKAGITIETVHIKQIGKLRCQNLVVCRFNYTDIAVMLVIHPGRIPCRERSSNGSKHHSSSRSNSIDSEDWVGIEFSADFERTYGLLLEFSMPILFSDKNPSTSLLIYDNNARNNINPSINTLLNHIIKFTLPTNQLLIDQFNNLINANKANTIIFYSCMPATILLNTTTKSMGEVHIAQIYLIHTSNSYQLFVMHNNQSAYIIDLRNVSDISSNQLDLTITLETNDNELKALVFYLTNRVCLEILMEIIVDNRFVKCIDHSECLKSQVIERLFNNIMTLCPTGICFRNNDACKSAVNSLYRQLLDKSEDIQLDKYNPSVLVEVLIRYLNSMRESLISPEMVNELIDAYNNYNQSYNIKLEIYCSILCKDRLPEDTWSLLKLILLQLFVVFRLNESSSNILQILAEKFSFLITEKHEHFACRENLLQDLLQFSMEIFDMSEIERDYYQRYIDHTKRNCENVVIQFLVDEDSSKLYSGSKIELNEITKLDKSISLVLGSSSNKHFYKLFKQITEFESIDKFLSSCFISYNSLVVCEILKCSKSRSNFGMVLNQLWMRYVHSGQSINQSVVYKISLPKTWTISDRWFLIKQKPKIEEQDEYENCDQIRKYEVELKAYWINLPPGLSNATSSLQSSTNQSKYLLLLGSHNLQLKCNQLYSNSNDVDEYHIANNWDCTIMYSDLKLFRIFPSHHKYSSISKIIPGSKTKSSQSHQLTILLAEYFVKLNFIDNEQLESVVNYVAFRQNQYY